MKITIEVSPDAARDFLRDIESKISMKLKAREELNTEIQKLEESANDVREKLQGSDGAGIRSPRGANRERIKEYLKTLSPGKGARMTQIRKSTGISVSSTAYTLRHYKKDFEQDKETKLWKLK